jgi:glycosyltransferase involved in cell wall biosynthesis
MKIAIISAFAIATPPPQYGGLEQVTYNYAVGLEQLGHDVTLIATKGSHAPKGVKLLETVEPFDKLTDEQKRAYAKADRLWNAWRAQEEAAYQSYKDLLPSFDVVGDHSWSKWSYSSKKDEIVGTCHSLKSYNVRPPREYPMLCGVSNPHARVIARELHVPARRSWNPVQTENFIFRKEKQDRVLSLNRIMPQKGIHKFVGICNELKLKADVAGDDSTLVGDQNYVNYIKQECKNSAFLTYHGLVSHEQRRELLANAKVLVCLKDVGYEEVFGLQAIEALASGTPVVAEQSWGFADTIVNGVNGYLCETVEQVKDAVKGIMDGSKKIDPEACLASAKRFSVQNSSKAYEGLFESVKRGNRW